MSDPAAIPQTNGGGWPGSAGRKDELVVAALAPGVPLMSAGVPHGVDLLFWLDVLVLATRGDGESFIGDLVLLCARSSAGALQVFNVQGFAGGSAIKLDTIAIVDDAIVQLIVSNGGPGDSGVVVSWTLSPPLESPVPVL